MAAHPLFWMEYVLIFLLLKTQHLMGLLQGKPKTKQQFKAKKLSGTYLYHHPKTGKLLESGQFEKGIEIGLWKSYDSDGDQMHCQYTKQRVGALCKDGTKTKAIGRGAGSHHGGVAQWIYENKMKRVGGTGKYMDISARVELLKQKAKAKLRLSKEGLELDQQLLLTLINITDKNSNLQSFVTQLQKSADITLSNINNTKQEILKMCNEVNQKYNQMELCLQNQKKKLQIVNQTLQEKFAPLGESFQTAKEQDSIQLDDKIKNREERVNKQISSFSEDELRKNMAQLIKCYEGMNSILKARQIKIEESSLYKRPLAQESHDDDLSELIREIAEKR